MTRKLAVDPGEKSGYAVFNDGVYNYSGGCRGDAETEKGFVSIRSILNSVKPDEIVIESQFIHPTRTKGIFTLVKRAVYWEALARLMGCKVWHVDPAEWQSYFGIKHDAEISRQMRREKDKKIKSRLRSEKSKKLKHDIVVKATEMSGKKCEENEADAILIGFYCIYKRI